MAGHRQPDPDADQIGPDPDTVRAAMRKRDDDAEAGEEHAHDASSERRAMDDPDMGEDEPRGDKDDADRRHEKGAP